MGQQLVHWLPFMTSGVCQGIQGFQVACHCPGGVVSQVGVLGRNRWSLFVSHGIRALALFLALARTVISVLLVSSATRPRIVLQLHSHPVISSLALVVPPLQFVLLLANDLAQLDDGA